MKALSIKQPWAAWIVLGAKDVENRTWRTKHRGPLLIYASKNYDDACLSMYDQSEARIASIKQAIYANPDDCKKDFTRLDVAYERGAIIGMVDVIFVGMRSDSPWCDPGVWQWVLANPVLFEKPIPYKGRLGLFDVPDELIDAALGASRDGRGDG